MKQLFNFLDTNTIITGGSSGIGMEIAKNFALSGSNVLIIGRNEEKLKKTVLELENEINKKIQYFKCDVQNQKDIDQLYDYTSEKFNKKLNILVNSAGINIRNPVESINHADWNEIIDINLTGTFRVTQKLLPLIKQSDFGRIINLGSIFATVSYPSRAAYAASKGGVIMFTKTLAIELAKSNITVNSISPGPLLTEINKAVLKDEENYKKFCEKIPIGRFGEPSEVITSIFFLASKYSSYVTGADIKVDGGWTIY